MALTFLFPLRFDSKPFMFLIQSNLYPFFAILLSILLPALRSTLSKNRLLLDAHIPVFLLVRFAWLPCLVSSICYSISQSHSLNFYLLSRLIVCAPQAGGAGTKTLRPFSAYMPCGAQQTSSPVRLFETPRATKPRAKACETPPRHRRKIGFVRPSHVKNFFTLLLAGIHQLRRQAPQPHRRKTAKFSWSFSRSYSLRFYLSRLIVCAPQAGGAGTKTLRPFSAYMPCGAQQTSSPVRLFETPRATKPRAKACETPPRHRRKIGFVRPSHVKNFFTLLLAGIHQLLISSSVCGLLSLSGYHALFFFMGFVVFFSCDLFSCSTPIKYLIKSLKNLKANLPIRKLYSWFCFLSLSVCSLNPFFQPVKLAIKDVSRALCVIPARCSLYRLLRCPFGNTPNNLLFVNLLKGCEL